MHADARPDSSKPLALLARSTCECKFELDRHAQDNTIEYVRCYAKAQLQTVNNAGYSPGFGIQV